MEENINPEIPETNLSEGDAYRPLKIENELSSNLLEMAKWAKYLFYVGVAGIMFLIALYILIFVLGAFKNINYFTINRIISLSIGCLIYSIPTYYLYKSSIQITNGVTNKNDDLIEFGALKMKSFLKYMAFYIVIIYVFNIIVYMVLTSFRRI